MITLLSPAKTLDTTSPLPTRTHSQPRLLDQAADLAALLRRKSPDEVAQLMHLPEERAAGELQRFDEFAPPFTPRNARPAALTFAGDVYRGMAPTTRFDARDWTEAQKTVRILSGLYGLLRPLDLIQPYRLEMGVRLETPRGANLYDWWGSLVTDLLACDLADSPGPAVVVDCASREYARVVRTEHLVARVITPRFLDADASGRYRVVSFHAKRARGEFAAWAVVNRVRSARALREFDGAGYSYDAGRSTPEQPTFIR